MRFLVYRIILTCLFHFQPNLVNLSSKLVKDAFNHIENLTVFIPNDQKSEKLATILFRNVLVKVSTNSWCWGRARIFQFCNPWYRANLKWNVSGKWKISKFFFPVQANNEADFNTFSRLLVCFFSAFGRFSHYLSGLKCHKIAWFKLNLNFQTFIGLVEKNMTKNPMPNYTHYKGGAERESISRPPPEEKRGWK